MSQINLITRHQRIGYMGEEKYYLTSSMTYSTITTEELVKFASENSGMPKAQMAAAFYAIAQQIEQFLFNGHSLEISDLGFFYLSVNARAVTEQSEAGAKAVKRISVQFRQSKKLREKLNSNVALVTRLEKEAAASEGAEESDKD